MPRRMLHQRSFRCSHDEAGKPVHFYLEARTPLRASLRLSRLRDIRIFYHGVRIPDGRITMVVDGGQFRPDELGKAIDRYWGLFETAEFRVRMPAGLHVEPGQTVCLELTVLGPHGSRVFSETTDCVPDGPVRARKKFRKCRK